MIVNIYCMECNKKLTSQEDVIYGCSGLKSCSQYEEPSGADDPTIRDLCEDCVPYHIAMHDLSSTHARIFLSGWGKQVPNKYRMYR